MATGLAITGSSQRHARGWYQVGAEFSGNSAGFKTMEQQNPESEEPNVGQVIFNSNWILHVHSRGLFISLLFFHQVRASGLQKVVSRNIWSLLGLLSDAVCLF